MRSITKTTYVSDAHLGQQQLRNAEVDISGSVSGIHVGETAVTQWGDSVECEVHPVLARDGSLQDGTS